MIPSHSSDDDDFRDGDSKNNHHHSKDLLVIKKKRKNFTKSRSTIFRDKSKKFLKKKKHSHDIHSINSASQSHSDQNGSHESQSNAQHRNLSPRQYHLDDSYQPLNDSSNAIDSSINRSRVTPFRPNIGMSSPTLKIGENDIVYLNIGGIEYTTDKITLYQFGPNYFTSLLEGNFSVMKDRNNRIFINRPGKYFGPILEYMITGDVIVPKDIDLQGLVREARFYCIHFPLDDFHESLSFVNDEYLLKKNIQASYDKISHLADKLLTVILKQFKVRAELGKPIESAPILMDDQSRVNAWLDTTEHGNQYWRLEFIDRQKKLYSTDGCIVSDDYYDLLANNKHHSTIVQYCKMNGLSLKIVSVDIHEPRVSNRRFFTIGYRFVHIGKYRDRSEFIVRRGIRKL